MPETPTRRSSIEAFRDHCRAMAENAVSDGERATWTAHADDVDAVLAIEEKEEGEPLW